MAMNPLSQFTKIEELSTKLVSNGVIPYKDGVLGSKGIKCGVCARSARDEMTLNTPDMLISGEAVSKIIENCVPNIENAEELYVNDVEQLLIAIKIASKEESYDINVQCPECSHNGRFERNLGYLLDTATSFTDIPVIELDNGLSVYVRPLIWKEHSEFAQRMFAEQQRSKHFEDDDSLSDEEKLTLFSELFESRAVLNFDMITSTIWKVVTPDGTEVTEKEFIGEWLGTQSKAVLKVIMEKMNEVMEVGISHVMEVECSECHHQWDIDGLRYDPSHFFDLSFSTQV